VNRTLRDIDDLPSRLRFALAIGVFDGVHRGHRRVIKALTAAAKRNAAQPVVLTFDPHPAGVLHNAAPPLVCDLQDRVAWLHQLGVATVVVQRFDDEFADQTPEAFLERLRRGRDLAALVMTPESAFGRDRAGTMDSVRRLAPKLGFELVEVGQLARHGATVSSTRLRAELAEGRLSEVTRLLGRPYAVIGTVVRGDARGRELGYPTANLAFAQPVALPADGIYAIRAAWGGKNPLEPTRRADGVASLGVRPTFASSGERILEAHLFDVNEDLYGIRLRIEFVRRLRGEKRFSSVAALVRQMHRDSVRATKVLARSKSVPGAY
jgi:riboflavin kinase / FMN adenylyltransferase